MDYHFNLQQGAQKKFKMSPFMHTPGFEKCFSTRSNAACSTSEAPMKPMLDLLTDFHSNQTMLKKQHFEKNPSNIHPSFSSSSSMSVSYIVGGFVSGQSQAGSSSSQNICNLLDVIVNSFNNTDTGDMEESFPETLQNYNLLSDFKISTINSLDANISPQRTYADVTKGVLPKSNALQERKIIPSKISNMNCEMNICANRMVAMCTANNCCIKNSNLLNMSSCINQSKVLTIPSETCSAKLMDRGSCYPNTPHCAVSENLSCGPKKCTEFSPFEDLIPSASLTQRTLLKLPINSSLRSPRINRTVSECSVDSDDSFVVFQNEEDTVCDSVSEEESLSDDLDEVDHHEFLTCLVSSPTIGSKKKTKKVSFKPDESLVEIHKMVVWDYAHRAARIGPWEIYALDRVRFKDRICKLSAVLSPILEASHRATVYRERFKGKN